jgi:hypothetical protein
MTTFTSASLFRDSVVGSSGCRGTVATWDKLDRLACDSGWPFRLSGLVSDERLGDRESWRDVGRDRWSEAEGCLDPEKDEAFVSIESDDFRCVYGC